jgi:hypothetical protein
MGEQLCSLWSPGETPRAGSRQAAERNRSSPIILLIVAPKEGYQIFEESAGRFESRDGNLKAMDLLSTFAYSI